MSGDEGEVTEREGLPSQKALDELEERVVQRILNKVAQREAGESSSKGASGGGECEDGDIVPRGLNE